MKPHLLVSWTLPEQVQQPLGEALKFLAPLLNLSSDKIETHFLAYAVHSRRRKQLLHVDDVHLMASDLQANIC